MTKLEDPVIIVGGGQSGLAAARAVRDAGLRPVVLEAGERSTGSWPRYYDSLTAFSPVQFNSLPGLPFPGDPDRYPTRDEVVDYLERYAENLDVEIHRNTRVDTVTASGDGFTVHTADGQSVHATGVIAATGSFSNPYVPVLPGQDGFTGELLHVADYRNPKSYAGKRVIVVGAGNSAIQVGYEVAEIASVTLATHEPLRYWVEQRPDGRDVHHRLVGSGFDDLPPVWLAQIIQGTPVLDNGIYREALEAGLLDRREMFTAFDGDRIIWTDGTHEQVDVVLFATGYRPNLGYLQALGALDADGMPRHTGGISVTHPGLVYVGLEFQRSFSSNTLRGVHRDADYVVRPLAAYVRDAAADVGV